MGGGNHTVPRFYYEPNFDCLVEPLKCCVSQMHPPAYQPITMGQYLEKIPLIKPLSIGTMKSQQTDSSILAEDGSQFSANLSWYLKASTMGLDC